MPLRFLCFPSAPQPRMYSKLALTGRRVLSSMEHPNRLILWQKHEYTIRVTGSKKVRDSSWPCSWIPPRALTCCVGR